MRALLFGAVLAVAAAGCGKGKKAPACDAGALEALRARLAKAPDRRDDLGAAVPRTLGADGAGAPEAAATSAQPRLQILTQYVRDLSFENIAAQKGIAAEAKPEIRVQVNIEVKQRAAEHYEVALKLKVDSKIAEAAVRRSRRVWCPVIWRAYPAEPDAVSQKVPIARISRMLQPLM